MGIKIETELDYGQRVTDDVTGFKGLVTAITQYQHGCLRVCVQPKADKEGKIPEAQWIDEPQLTGKRPKKPHGPQQDAIRRVDPSRN